MRQLDFEKQEWMTDSWGYESVSYGDRGRGQLDELRRLQYPVRMLTLFSEGVRRGKAGSHGGERLTIRSVGCWGYDVWTCWVVLDKT